MSWWSAVEAKTSDYTLTSADDGKLFHTTGATGAVAFTLPNSLPANFRAGFLAAVAQVVTVKSDGAASIRNDGTVSSANPATLSSAGAKDDFIELTAAASADWRTTQVVGTWS